MNYSTLKKTVVLSFVSLMAVGAASAQTDSVKVKTMTMADTATTAKVFGGIGQYNTFSIGVNVGVTSGLVPFLQNSTNHFKASLGYGATLRQQLSHAFSLQLDYYGGKVKGEDEADGSATSTKFGHSSFETSFNQFSLSGVVNFGSVSFLHRQNSVNFYGSAGVGLDFYSPKNVDGIPGNSYPNTVKELAAPVGVGVKFKLTDALALNLGYTVTFIQGYNFSGFNTYPTFNHYAYTYGGLEY
ncbi:MAG: DUF6089 family protein, partial [Mucilaginibacter sp.]